MDKLYKGPKRRRVRKSKPSIEGAVLPTGEEAKKLETLMAALDSDQVVVLARMYEGMNDATIAKVLAAHKIQSIERIKAIKKGIFDKLCPEESPEEQHKVAVRLYAQYGLLLDHTKKKRSQHAEERAAIMAACDPEMIANGLEGIDENMLDLARFLAKGRTYAQIAEALDIEHVNTVRGMLTELFNELRLHRSLGKQREQFVAAGYRIFASRRSEDIPNDKRAGESNELSY